MGDRVKGTRGADGHQPGQGLEEQEWPSSKKNQSLRKKN